jgi:hypothetical protein
MSVTSGTLLGLALGVVLGVAGAASQHPALLALVPSVEPIGTLWLNALRIRCPGGLHAAGHGDRCRAGRAVHFFVASSLCGRRCAAGARDLGTGASGSQGRRHTRAGAIIRWVGERDQEVFVPDLDDPENELAPRCASACPGTSSRREYVASCWYRSRTAKGISVSFTSSSPVPMDSVSHGGLEPVHTMIVRGASPQRRGRSG